MLLNAANSLNMTLCTSSERKGVINIVYCCSITLLIGISIIMWSDMLLNAISCNCSSIKLSIKETHCEDNDKGLLIKAPQAGRLSCTDEDCSSHSWLSFLSNSCIFMRDPIVCVYLGLCILGEKRANMTHVCHINAVHESTTYSRTISLWSTMVLFFTITWHELLWMNMLFWKY